MSHFQSINFNGKKVLVRVDFNVPLNDSFQITDDTRIKAALPTINKIIQDGGSVILMSHLGRPKLGPEEKFSLKHIVQHLSSLSGVDVKFCEDCIGEKAKNMAEKLGSGEVLLLENLRFYKHETAGDLNFAKQLAELGDFYVNDAFGTAHRAHASTTMVANFFTGNKSFGYLLENEINSIQKVLESPEKPLTAIIGGAKISSKISIIENLFNIANNIIIGGGMAYTFIKAQGGHVGNSLVEEDQLETALKIIDLAKAKGVQLALPTDTIIADGFSNDANRDECSIDEIPSGWMGLDIGKNSIESFKKIVLESKTILWNGPMGVFEFSNFEEGTKSIGLSVVEATSKGAFSLIGGGDSVAAINKYDLASQVSYVSTGGGAMLEYLEGKRLPGIIAIQEKEGFRIS